MSNKFALVTGASSGIGMEIATYLASKGINILLTARREERLQKLAENLSKEYKVTVDYIACDLSNEHAPNDIYAFCKSKDYQIDILINNAGYGIKTPFHETSMKDEEKFIRVLGTSVIALTKIFLPDMITNKNGKIMIVSSVAAFSKMPIN